MVANCLKKKVDFIFQRIKEDLQRKANIREEKKNQKEIKERNRALEVNIIKKRQNIQKDFLKGLKAEEMSFGVNGKKQNQERILDQNHSLPLLIKFDMGSII